MDVYGSGFRVYVVYGKDLGFIGLGLTSFMIRI